MSNAPLDSEKERVPRVSRVMDAAANVDTDSVEEVVLEMPFDGWVTEVFTQFPPGSNNQVGIKVYDESSADRIFPENEGTEFITGDDYAKAWRVVEPVEEGEKLTITHDNRDTNNPHYSGVQVTIVSTDIEMPDEDRGGY